MSKQKQPKPLDRPMLDLYADYLISSFSFTTATGMSAALDGAISHDAISRFLSDREYTNKDLWKLVKPVVREIETEDGVLILDDTQYTDENDIVAWHYDHVFSRSVKGVNILSCIYASERGTVPVGCVVVKKDLLFTDPETEKLKRKSSVTKNEQARELPSRTRSSSATVWRIAGSPQRIPWSSWSRGVSISSLP